MYGCLVYMLAGRLLDGEVLRKVERTIGILIEHSVTGIEEWSVRACPCDTIVPRTAVVAPDSVSPLLVHLVPRENVVEETPDGCPREVSADRDLIGQCAQAYRNAVLDGALGHLADEREGGVRYGLDEEAGTIGDDHRRIPRCSGPRGNSSVPRCARPREEVGECLATVQDDGVGDVVIPIDIR